VIGQPKQAEAEGIKSKARDKKKQKEKKGKGTTFRQGCSSVSESHDGERHAGTEE
jgi:hypothetical protein